jgi:catechol-2,3-dioxygenase
MKRFHVHLAVKDLKQSIRFYSSLFGAPPTVEHADYAKWMLDDPRVNFAVSQRGHMHGLDHLGLQVETSGELNAMTAAMKQANLTVTGEGAAVCCYAVSDKGWVHDPQGIPWESFVTHGAATTYGADRSPRGDARGACCAPAAQSA